MLLTRIDASSRLMTTLVDIKKYYSLIRMKKKSDKLSDIDYDYIYKLFLSRF